MSINFSCEQWDSVRDSYGKWWNGRAERAVIPIIINGVDPKRDCPSVPLLSQANCLDFTFSAEQIVDRIEYELCTRKYLGDAFPYFSMDCFGPGVLAALLGAKADNHTGGVWFSDVPARELEELHFTYQPENALFKRIKGIYKAAVNRFEGNAIMGMLDLGGVLDVLASFRGTDNLLIDLYDNPTEVKRCLSEIRKLWFVYYEEINGIFGDGRSGYTDWSGIYSNEPSYVLQSDFSYMIGNDMFKLFAKDDIEDATKRLQNTMFHLDGAGQLNHLDDILSMKSLNAVQWVPGDGAPPQKEWIEVYKKIHNAKKGIQFFDGLDTVDFIAEQIGTYSGLLQTAVHFDKADEEYAISRIKKYGIVI